MLNSNSQDATGTLPLKSETGKYTPFIYFYNEQNPEISLHWNRLLKCWYHEKPLVSRQSGQPPMTYVTLSTVYPEHFLTASKHICQSSLNSHCHSVHLAVKITRNLYWEGMHSVSLKPLTFAQSENCKCKCCLGPLFYIE